MPHSTVSWDEDTLVIRVPFAEFSETIILLDHGERRHLLVDKEAFKAFIAEEACRAPPPGRTAAGQAELLTAWMDALVERAATASAGIRTVANGAAARPASASAPERGPRRGGRGTV